MVENHYVVWKIRLKLNLVVCYMHIIGSQQSKKIMLKCMDNQGVDVDHRDQRK
jgi:hypothetical protein